MQIGDIRYVRCEGDNRHPEYPMLFSTDVIGGQCPFPTKTETFEVVAFGRPSVSDPHAHADAAFALVLYRKLCGHNVLERISFAECIETFEHCGQIYRGSSYSIRDWKRRIEWFRHQLDCDACELVNHTYFCWSSGLSVRNRKKAIANLECTLNAVIENWRELLNWDEVQATIEKISYGSDSWKRRSVNPVPMFSKELEAVSERPAS